jgi:ClpP class serine protease
VGGLLWQININQKIRRSLNKDRSGFSPNTQAGRQFIQNIQQQKGSRQMRLSQRRKKVPMPDDNETQSAPDEKPAAAAIKEIEKIIQEPVLVYTSRRSLGVWDVPPLHKLLDQLGSTDKLSVILQSFGGHADGAFKMANVIREFAKDVTFIVPYYAKSAATLLCLSGNKILMGPISELGPTNPMMSVDERLITPTLPDFARIATEPLEKESRQRQMAAHALRDFLIAAGVLRSDGKGYDPRSFVRIHGEWSTQSFFAGGF